MVLDRATVNGFIAELLESGAEATTARSRQLAVRRYSAWCAEEGEADRDELLGLKPPKLDVKVVPRLTDEQCRALVKACTGREFRDRRNEAIVRFMLEAIVRAGEVVAMGIGDVDLTRGLAIARRGKGGKGRPGALRGADQPGHRPVPAAATFPPARADLRAMAGRPGQEPEL